MDSFLELLAAGFEIYVIAAGVITVSLLAVGIIGSLANAGY